MPDGTNPRDLNNEYRDVEGRKYAYDFDGVIRRYMMRAFEPFLPPRSAKALELGCFMGDVTALLKKRFDDLTVVEGASDLLEATRARIGDEGMTYYCAMFENLDLPAESEAIFLIHVLEHLDEPVEVMKKISQWLAPKGRFFLMSPNANAPSRQIAVKMGLISHNTAVTEAEEQHGHRRTYTLDTLERDARDAGFRIVHRGGVLFKPLANFQFDKLLGTDILSDGYLDGLFDLGMIYPDLSASVFLVCEKD